jgi:hypothetical protein
MSEDLDDIVENLREPSAWARVVFMLGFSLVLYMVIIPLTLLLTLAQALFSVFTGEDNDNLRHFGASLLAYISQVVRFLTFNSDERPFPFSDFPEDQGEGRVEGEAEEVIAQAKQQAQTKSAEADSPAGSEPAVKKSVKRKPPSKKTAKKTTKKAKKKASKKTVKPVKDQTPKSGNADEKTESDETKE